jgi:hypothetical protein
MHTYRDAYIQECKKKYHAYIQGCIHTGMLKVYHAYIQGCIHTGMLKVYHAYIQGCIHTGMQKKYHAYIQGCKKYTRRRLAAIEILKLECEISPRDQK